MSGLRLILAVLSIPVFLAAASTSLAGAGRFRSPRRATTMTALPRNPTYCASFGVSW